MLRYDYEECDGPSAQKMMDHLQSLVDSKDLPGKTFKGDSKEFVVSKVVDDAFFGVRLGGDEVEQRIRKCFDHPVVASVRVRQNCGFCPTFWNIFVLQLLGERQIERLVVQTFAFPGMNFFGPRSDDSQSSAGDVAEANVEAGWAH